MRGSFSYGTQGLLSVKCRTGQQRRRWEYSEGLGEEVLELRTFTVYEDLCAISVRPHQYSLIVYLLVGQVGLAVDDFQELYNRVSQQSLCKCPRQPGARLRASGETNSVGDAIGEAHELDFIFWTLPIRIEGENEAEGRCLRVCWGVGKRNVSQGRCGTVDVVGGAHGAEKEYAVTAGKGAHSGLLSVQSRTCRDRRRQLVQNEDGLTLENQQSGKFGRSAERRGGDSGTEIRRRHGPAKN